MPPSTKRHDDGPQAFHDLSTSGPDAEGTIVCNPSKVRTFCSQQGIKIAFGSVCHSHVRQIGRAITQQDALPAFLHAPFFTRCYALPVTIPGRKRTKEVDIFDRSNPQDEVAHQEELASMSFNLNCVHEIVFI